MSRHTQADLFTELPTSVADPEQEARLDAARQRVRALMADGRWHTREEIDAAGGIEGLRRFRELRQQHRARGCRAEKRHEGGGLWSYRLCAPGE